MYKQLTKLTLVTAFGKGSDHPMRKARLLIFGGGFGLIIVGRLAAKSVASLSLARDNPDIIIFIATAILIFIICGLIMLPMTQIIDSRQSISSKNLLILPLSRFNRWFVIVAPMLITALILSMLFLPILWSLNRQLYANFHVMLAGYIIGLSAALGLAVFNGIKFMTLKYLSFVGLTASLLYLLDLIVKTANQTAYTYLIILILFLNCFGLMQRFLNPVLIDNGRSIWLSKFIIPKSSLLKFWYVLKLLRNKKTLTSLSFCLIIGSALAIFSYARHQSTLTYQNIIMFSSILAASLACDVRGICRHYKTPEIHLFKGVNYFVNSQIRSLIWLNGLVIAPLFTYMIKTGILNDWSALLSGMVIVFAGSMLGLLSSAIFVPEGGELGSQFFAALLAISSLMYIPKMLNHLALDTLMLSIAWLCVAGMSCLVILTIEERRRKAYGHI